MNVGGPTKTLGDHAGNEPGVIALDKQCGSVRAQFRPDEGGRLARLQYREVDLVLPPGRVPGYYGDTFWPSPQALFDWPPPPVLDAAPYEVLDESPTALVMRSAPDLDHGLQVEKRVTLQEASVTFTFVVTNTWQRAHAVAPWQVTRAPRTGLLVWAVGHQFSDEDRLRKQREDPGCTYLHAGLDATFEGYSVAGPHASIPVADVTRTSKFFTDAHGWVAHIHDGVIFLRIFPDLVPEQMAPRQAELELFFGIERDYIELENQGAYEPIAPGASRTYEVEWRFAQVDPAVRTDRVSSELLKAIHALLEGGEALNPRSGRMP